MILTYTTQGDYLLPDLTMEQEQTNIGKYGMLRKTFLQKNRKALYASLLMSGKLMKHLVEIDRIAREQIELIILQEAKTQGVTEAMKASDPMKWTGLMNNIKQAAEETILAELIYS